MRIVTRQQWGARAPRPVTPRPERDIVAVCYHHTVTAQPSPWRSGAAICRQVQAEHMDGRGYADVGYHALVGPGGRVYAGRAFEALGAHSDGTYDGASANRVTLGVAFLGNYQHDRLTVRAKRAALALEYLWALRLGRALDVTMHRETKATACPGDHVAAWIAERGY